MQFEILRRVRVIEAARQDTHSARRQRAAMCGGIYAACEAGDDCEAGLAKIGGDTLREHER